MQIANPVTANVQSTVVPSYEPGEAVAEHEAKYSQYKVIRRNGAVVGFEPPKIAIAMKIGRAHV